MTAPGERSISLRLTGGNPAAINALLAGRRQLPWPPCRRRAPRAATRLITLPFADCTRELRAMQARLAAALPTGGAGTAGRCATAPSADVGKTVDASGILFERYVEQIDLGSAWQTWESRADQLGGAGRPGGYCGGGGEPEARPFADAHFGPTNRGRVAEAGRGEPGQLSDKTHSHGAGKALGGGGRGHAPVEGRNPRRHPDPDRPACRGCRVSPRVDCPGRLAADLKITTEAQRTRRR